MSNLPAHFIADLRYPIAYPDLDAGQLFQWSSLPMIELSALDTYQFVKSMLPDSVQTILEVGCGNGSVLRAVESQGIFPLFGIDVNEFSIRAGRTRTQAGIAVAACSAGPRASAEQ